MQGVQTRPKPGLLLCLDLGVEHVPSLENLLVAESEQRHVLNIGRVAEAVPRQAVTVVHPLDRDWRV